VAKSREGDEYSSKGKKGAARQVRGMLGERGTASRARSLFQSMLIDIACELMAMEPNFRSMELSLSDL